MKITVPLATLAALLVGCAGAPPVATVAVPEPLKPPAGEVLTLVVPAKGVQIYECRPAKDKPGVFEWGFVAPDAELFDRRGSKIGKHYAGPVWEAADGSKLAGAVKGRADAPTAGAIPWLLLGTMASGPQGSFSKVSFIQRVNTVGGVAPAGACGPANTGATARVPYTADYYFLGEAKATGSVPERNY
jgi:hypothetical protein